MKFIAVQNQTLGMLERFRTQGTVSPETRKELIPIAAQCETRRLQDEFHAVQAQGARVTHRGPTSKETLERSLDTRTELKKNEFSKHELATLHGDDEPYQETYEFTRFRPDGISHATITILGDGGVGVGGICGRAEFLSPDPGKSWYEDIQSNFLGQDLLSIYQQGTYQPTV